MKLEESGSDYTIVSGSATFEGNRAITVKLVQ